MVMVKKKCTVESIIEKGNLFLRWCPSRFIFLMTYCGGYLKDINTKGVMKPSQHNGPWFSLAKQQEPSAFESMGIWWNYFFICNCDDDSGALWQGKDGESSIPSFVKTFIVMEQVALAATTIGIGKQAFVGSSRTTGMPLPSIVPWVSIFVCQHSYCPFLSLKLLTWPHIFL